ncbi:MAG: YqgE/AlgH family protein [Micavibrio sp.]|nr:YqgE/AlgH family protein [Micavibrio sp.]
MTKAPPKKTRNKRFDGYGMVVLAALLLWIGGKYDYKPQDAHHQIILSTPTKETEGNAPFDKTVVLVVQHFKRGAMGLILNRKSPDGDYMIGGPVDKDKVFALHSLDVKFPETVPMDEIFTGILEGAKAVSELEHADKKPAWYRIYHGYVGWGRYQLDREMTDGQWEIVEFDPKFFTDTPADKMWDAGKRLPIISRTH